MLLDQQNMIAFRRCNLILPLLIPTSINAFVPTILKQHISLQVAPVDRRQNFASIRSITSTSFRMASSDNNAAKEEASGNPHVENVLFVECGFGNDSHGQSSTKAAVRAARQAIEFNSIPSVNRLVPGGYDNLKLDVILAVPPKYQDGLDLDAVAKVFPYGETKFTVQDGGMIAPSGIAIDRLGDKNEDMVIVCCSVTVGY